MPEATPAPTNPSKLSPEDGSQDRGHQEDDFLDAIEILEIEDTLDTGMHRVNCC